MSGHSLAGVHIVVLAGGLGTRISPVLGGTPKLLAPVDGRPYLDYLVDWMAGFGATHVTLCLGHLSQAIIDHLSAHPPAISVDWVVEPESMGTAGALRFARGRIESDPALVCNGDSFTKADLGLLVERHRSLDPEATLLCTQVDDTARYGRVLADAAHRIIGFEEKGQAGPGLINAGVYLLSARLLDKIAATDARSLETEIFARLPPGSLAEFSGAFPFIDIGTPETLRAATADMLSFEQDR